MAGPGTKSKSTRRQPRWTNHDPLGIVSTGGREDNAILAPLEIAQAWPAAPASTGRLLVSARQNLRLLFPSPRTLPHREPANAPDRLERLHLASKRAWRDDRSERHGVRAGAGLPGVGPYGAGVERVSSRTEYNQIVNNGHEFSTTAR